MASTAMDASPGPPQADRRLTMRHVEWRGWIRVNGLSVEADDAEALLGALLRGHLSLGPVLSGAGDGLDVILGTDQPTKTLAERELVAAVSDGLTAAGLSSYGIGKAEVEPA